MRLISLTIYKKNNNEIIRNIKFNPNGLSLICDDANDEKHSFGSSVGKSTLIRCIDICLGAKTNTSVYKSQSHGENVDLKKYIYDNKISLQLVVENNQDKVYILERHLFDKKEFIDGVEYNNVNDYTSKLKNIFFPNSPSLITFRNLITKFIRMDNENLFKYRDNYAKNIEYYYAYFYLLGLYYSEDEVYLSNKKNDLKNNLDKIKNKYKIKNLDDLNELKQLYNDEVEEKRKKFKSIKYVDNFMSCDDKNLNMVFDIDNITDELYVNKMRLNVLQSNIINEDKKLLDIDKNVLVELYNDANDIFGNLINSFDEFVSFHNSMCLLRKEGYISEINKVKENISNLENKLAKARINFTENFIDFKKTVNDTSNSLYEQYFIQKQKYCDFIKDYDLYVDNDKKIKEIQKVLLSIENNKQNNINIQNEINSLFKKKSIYFIKKCYELEFDNNPFNMPISAKGLGGALGTGDNKALICALDFSFYEFYKKNNLDLPFFVIHDRMENVSLDELDRIFNDVRVIGVQYILPILHDRIDTLKIEEKEVILHLSQEDKLFKF